MVVETMYRGMQTSETTLNIFFSLHAIPKRFKMKMLKNVKGDL